MADKEPNTVLDVQKVKRIKELPNGNATFSGWVHLAREDDQAGGCGSFSETLTCQSRGKESILLLRAILV